MKFRWKRSASATLLESSRLLVPHKSVGKRTMDYARRALLFPGMYRRGFHFLLRKYEFAPANELRIQRYVFSSGGFRFRGSYTPEEYDRIRPSASSGTKILVGATDLHGAPRNQQILEQCGRTIAESIRPHLLLLGGDLGDIYHQDSLREDVRIFLKYVAESGKTNGTLSIFSPGNHDYLCEGRELHPDLPSLLDEHGVLLLRNDVTECVLGKRKFRIIGLGSALCGDLGSVREIMKNRVQEEDHSEYFSIVISHEPIGAQELEENLHDPLLGKTNLWLLGHVHGLHRRLIATVNRLRKSTLNMWDTKYNKGFHEIATPFGMTQIVASTGVGMHYNDIRMSRYLFRGTHQQQWRAAPSCIEVFEITSSDPSSLRS